METHTIEFKWITQRPRIPAFLCLLAVLLTACSSSSSVSQSSGSGLQAQVGGQPPVILRVSEHQEVVDGYLFFYQDINFTDPDGDAVAITYEVTSSSLTYPLKFPDTPIEASAEEQMSEARFVETTACWQRMELSYESRIQDRVGNLSEPVLMVMSCTAPQPVDTRPFLISGISTAVPIALALLLGFWLLFRKRPAERLPALRSMVLMFFLFMLLKFLHFLLHEGGHGLYILVSGAPVTLYVHPFLFSGFARPIIIGASLWQDVLGSVTAILAGFLVFVLFWKHRSPGLLPLAMLFPYIALLDGFNLMGITGDYWNVVQSTGLPAALFYILGALLICFGIISFLSLLPLASLDRRDTKALFVLPAALFLMSALSFLVAHLFVPGSPIDREFFVGRELLIGANSFILTLVLGVVLAVLYVILFRKLYPRLPVWLRTETVTLTWKDLRLSAILWAFSVVTGLIIVI